MRVRVLGGVAVGDDGLMKPIGAPRPRLILALLASRHGSFVGDDVLIEAIWGDDAPASSRTALQTYVSALRDELEPDRRRREPGRFIVSGGDGYSLQCDVDDLDSTRFVALIDRARSAHTHDPDAAVALLDEALGLWADPPFGQYADQPWAIGAATRLKDLHASAHESRFGLALEAGAEGELLAAMDHAVAQYPYRERLAGQRILSLYRSGRQRAALEQYALTRQRLLDDLGLDPGRELQLLERAILAQDPALRMRERDTSIATKVRLPDAPTARQLVGRDDEIHRVTALVRRERCVSIVGPGGAGKSALAANVAHELESVFGERIHHVDVGELSGRDVLRSLAAGVRVVEHPLAPLADCITDAIGDQPTLLIMETCEVAVDEVSTVVSAVASAPGAHFVITSQVPLHLQMEHVVRLGPLKPDAAVTLLTRSRASTRHDPAQLIAIADRLDRLPLGLELAAGRLDALGADELLRELDAGADRLSGAADRPARQRSVRLAVEWSLGLLDDDLRRTLSTLVVFSSPFSIDSARAVTGDMENIVRSVSELCDRSLIERLASGPTRFRIPDSVRDVIRRTADPADLAAARVRLSEVCLESAQSVVFGAEAAVELDQLHDEVVPAIDHFAELGDQRQLLLAGLLGIFFIESGRISEGREHLRRALESHGDAPEVVRMLTSAQLGFLAWYQGDLIACRRLLGGVMDLLDRGVAPGFLAAASGCLAFLEHRFDDAAADLCAAADAASGDTKQRMLLLHLSGNASWYAGDHTEAIVRYRTQREISRAVNDRFHTAQALRFEAMVAAQIGDVEAGWRWAERSLTMSKEIADSVSLAQSEAAAAAVTSMAGVFDEALDHATSAIRASLHHFDVFALRTVLPIAADGSLRGGDAVTAARLIGWYLDLLDRTGQTPSPATAHLPDIADRSREAVGAVEFARLGAKGASVRVGDLAALAASIPR